MTALAFDLRPNRITVATDTLHAAPAPEGELPRHRPAALRTKPMVFADFHMVIVGRGVAADIGHGVHLALLQNWMLASGDSAFAALPGLFVEVTNNYMRQLTPGETDWLDRVLYEFLVFHWSKAEGRFLGHYGANYRLPGYAGAYAPVRLEDGINCVPAVAPDDFERIVAATPPADAEAKLVGLLSHLKSLHDRAGDGGIGGEIEAVTLWPHELRQRVVHHFSDADAVEATVAHHAAGYTRETALAALQGAMATVDVAAFNRAAAERGHYYPAA